MKKKLKSKKSKQTEKKSWKPQQFRLMVSIVAIEFNTVQLDIKINMY